MSCVLAWSTQRDLVIASDLDFDACGTYQLKGVRGERHLVAVASG
jgi:hypothetical protein